MRHLIYFIVLLSVISCKKKSVEPDSTISTAGSIEYKLNGDVIKMDNVNLLTGETVELEKHLRGIGLADTRYLLNSQKLPNNFLSFTIVTDSLIEQTYHYDSAVVSNNFSEFTFDIDDRGVFISLYFSTDYLDIHISSYKDSRISGTFEGRLSIVTGNSFADFADRGSIYVTEGEFHNIPVTY